MFEKSTQERGFTLIELLVVISIIGLLSSVVLSSLNTARANARDSARVSEIRNLVNAFNLYWSDNGQYPPLSAPNRTVCLGLSDSEGCWSEAGDPFTITGSTALVNQLSPYISASEYGRDPQPDRGWGDNYLYVDGAAWLGGCGTSNGGRLQSGQFILYRLDAEPVSGSAQCEAGFYGCCPTDGPCSSNGGFYCAIPIQQE